ncbi:MAG: hypothetical protein H0T46_18635, partial [Deltaproteobacteria bacterium]|nr:hypothetical protein [Deltaproteobacteria bacterium]
MRLVALLAVMLCACGGSERPPVQRAKAPPPLPAPIAIDGRARGAAYLTAVSQQLQPPWGQFLEDCRLRLPPAHPLNVTSLEAHAELAIDRTGKLVGVSVTTSGLADYDLAIRQILADTTRLGAPPAELLSDDDQLHVRWLFARDLRQAGAATAEIVTVELPVLQITERLLARGDLARAAGRIANAKPTDPERAPAAELVMIAALREALGSTGAAARTSAVEAVGRANVRVLASQVRAFLAPTVDTDLRLAAVTTAAALGDRTAVPVITRQLPADLANYPKLALADIAALVRLGARDDAAAAVQKALEADPALPSVSALTAHALVPISALAPKLTGWFASGDARTRAAVCAAVPTGTSVPAYVERGLRDADATVRATCVDAASRQGRASRANQGLVRRIRELALDRDRGVRARAVAALAIMDTARPPRAAGDPHPEVRAASIASASELELKTMTNDPDPDVRAAAVAMLADRSPDLTARAAADVAPQVRLAAIGALTREDT